MVSRTAALPSRGHAVHVTTVHAPRDPRIFQKEVRSLHRAGWRVTLVAPADQDDTLDGVRLIALRRRRGRLRRMTLTVMEALLRVRRLRPDVIHVHDPELLPMAMLLRLGGPAVVYDAHEDLPTQIAGKPWVRAWAVPAASWGSAVLLRLGAAAMDAVVAATESVAQRYPRSKRVVVHNYPDLTVMQAAEPGERLLDRPPDVAYVGGISLARGLRPMLAAMALLPDVAPRLHVAGTFQPASLEGEVRELPGADRAIWHGWQTPAEVAGLLRRVRIGICVLQPLPNYVESLPTKLFEYMAAGLPVVASDFPAWRDIVETAGCGFLVDPTQPAEIAEAIAALLSDPVRAETMGRAGRQAVVDRYRWEEEAAKLIDLYAHLTR